MCWSRKVRVIDFTFFVLVEEIFNFLGGPIIPICVWFE
jgi:hypothetical protein